MDKMLEVYEKEDVDRWLAAMERGGELHESFRLTAAALDAGDDVYVSVKQAAYMLGRLDGHPFSQDIYVGLVGREFEDE